MSVAPRLFDPGCVKILFIEVTFLQSSRLGLA